MNIEITKEAFSRLVSIEDRASKIENKELYSKQYYNVCGLTVFSMTNYASATTTYHIQDINS